MHGLGPRLAARAVFWLCVLQAAAMLPVKARAARPADVEPDLVLETGSHRAAIHRMAADARERILVTASDDKTVRVWDLRGQLLQTLRPPVARGDEGIINAVAVSPDGTTIAAAGFTGHAWDRSMSVYLFSREGGALTARIKGLPNVVQDLAYSPDGRVLVAGMARRNGIRVYDTASLKQVAMDADYDNDVTDVAFDRSGRLVTVSLDGHVRLYDPEFKLLSKQRAPGGEHPSSVAITPDGKLVAVGFLGARQVNVLSGKDLKFMHAPDTKGVINGDLSRVAFSPDGRTLYAAGMFDRDGDNPIRAWSNAGRGRFKDLVASRGAITHLLPLGDGVAFTSGDASWGIFNRRGKRVLVQRPNHADLRNIRENLEVSDDGKTVRFWFGGRASFATFSVGERAYVRKAATRSPVMAANSVEVRGWRNTTTPSVNSMLVRLSNGERARSMAITPDRLGFVLGAEWSINHYDRRGRRVWHTRTPAIAWGVNVSGDGKLAVAALGDGTIRWYRMSDGKELLALFPHPDKKNWALFTPGGFFEASDEGLALLGWQSSTGPDEATAFHPATDRMEQRRADVTLRVLELLDEDAAAKSEQASAE